MKIEFELSRGVGRGGGEENCPKKLFFLGKRHDKSAMLLSRNRVVIAQAPKFNELRSPR